LVTRAEARLTVALSYAVRRTGELRTDTFTRDHAMTRDVRRVAERRKSSSPIRTGTGCFSRCGGGSARRACISSARFLKGCNRKTSASRAAGHFRIKATKIEIDRSDDPEVDDCLRITLDRFGDFSTYRLCLVEKSTDTEEQKSDARDCACKVAFRPLSGMDPRYACIDFSFKVDCPSDLVQARPACPPVVSARKLLPREGLRELPADLHRRAHHARLARAYVPDIGVARSPGHAGDYLSYHQTPSPPKPIWNRADFRPAPCAAVDTACTGCNARLGDRGPRATVMAASDFYFITGLRASKRPAETRCKPTLLSVPRSRYGCSSRCASTPRESTAAHSRCISTPGATRNVARREGQPAPLDEGPADEEPNTSSDAGNIALTRQSARGARLLKRATH
jgi:hypothetical protein